MNHDLQYPRPLLRRKNWLSLNGKWDFAFDDLGKLDDPSQIKDWPLEIEVPFAPESPLSGVQSTQFHHQVWYRKQLEFKQTRLNGKVLLHFGAVDYVARVWVNGEFVGSHQGGHTPFYFDISPILRKSGPSLSIEVCAKDDPHDLAKPRGKQDWQLEPHSIWYPRTTGIWQSVWIEEVSDTSIESLRWEPHLERWEIGFEAFIRGERRSGMQIHLRLSHRGQILVNDRYEVVIGEVHRRIALSDPGIDDYRNELLWSPESPHLIDAEIQLWENNELLDEVHSYTALRNFSIHKDRFMLNGRPYYLRLVLDQGYWPESYMTAPNEAALRKDIEIVKEMGFNGVRKHQKIEDPLFFYWADRLGLIVWEEMPSAYRFSPGSVERLTKEWIEVIDRDFSHPCIAVWVPLNESWGVPDLGSKAAHQNFVQAIYYLTKTLDPTRPVIGNDGWESVTTDIIGIHDYDSEPGRMTERYGSEVTPADILVNERPGGRVLLIEGHPHKGQPIMLTEFGGVSIDTRLNKDPKAWGYSKAKSAKEFEVKYHSLLRAVRRSGLLSGFCYTQLTDTFQEANGILTADRKPKFPIESIRAANLGLPIPKTSSLNEESSKKSRDKYV